MATPAVSACKRCKTRKLKCDDDPKKCKNCQRTGQECVQIDARSRREYPRGYIEELQQRIDHLQMAKEGSRASLEAVPSAPTALSSVSPTAHSTYHGEGSVISMGRLVEAATVSHASGPAIIDGRVRAEQHDRTSRLTETSPALLPPQDIARNLLASYLNGPHNLHPFLNRNSLYKELNQVYYQPESVAGSVRFRIFMVLAIGAVSLVRAGLHDTQAMDYYVAAMQHADVSLGMSSMEHIQALLLVLLFSLQHDIGVGNKWDLAQVAMRICIEKGYHRKCNRLISSIELQMQRRVFWACYINDRHSSSVLGRPMVLQDEDIDAELPVDADDDLVESGYIENQILRGMSEVSAQLRQIRLRQVTSAISTTLYRKSANHTLDALQTSMEPILKDLCSWRASFPMLVSPRNVYDTTHWRDLNFYRERLKCFRPFILLGKENDDRIYRESLYACQEASIKVASLYMDLRTSDKLVLNWTCVHDMMSAGFTTLFCALLHRDTFQADGRVHSTCAEELPTLEENAECIIDTLSHIAKRWPSVGKHVSVFKALANRVTESVRPGAFVTGDEAWPRMMSSPGPTSGQSDTMAWDAENLGHQAEVWDAAMISFLNEPFDLGSINWGAVDWDSYNQLNL